MLTSAHAPLLAPRCDELWRNAGFVLFRCPTLDAQRRLNSQQFGPNRPSCAYDAAVLGVLGRRGVEAGISLFAVLGFCYVPLGGHTGFEHAKAVFSTPAAKRAGAELLDALIRVRAKLTGEVQAVRAAAAPKRRRRPCPAQTRRRVALRTSSRTQPR